MALIEATRVIASTGQGSYCQSINQSVNQCTLGQASLAAARRRRSPPAAALVSRLAARRAAAAGARQAQRLAELPEVAVLEAQRRGQLGRGHQLHALEQALGLGQQALAHLQGAGRGRRAARVLGAWSRRGACRQAGGGWRTLQARATRWLRARRLDEDRGAACCHNIAEPRTSGARRSKATRQRVDGPHSAAHVSTNAGVEGLAPSWSM